MEPCDHMWYDNMLYVICSLISTLLPANWMICYIQLLYYVLTSFSTLLPLYWMLDRQNKNNGTGRSNIGTPRSKWSDVSSLLAIDNRGAWRNIQTCRDIENKIRSLIVWFQLNQVMSWRYNILCFTSRNWDYCIHDCWSFHIFFTAENIFLVTIYHWGICMARYLTSNPPVQAGVAKLWPRSGVPLIQLNYPEIILCLSIKFSSQSNEYLIQWGTQKITLKSLEHHWFWSSGIPEHFWTPFFKLGFSMIFPPAISVAEIWYLAFSMTSCSWRFVSPDLWFPTSLAATATEPTRHLMFFFLETEPIQKHNYGFAKQNQIIIKHYKPTHFFVGASLVML